jgi:hypothetical protein
MEIDRNAPSTKGDLEDFKVEVNTRFEQFEHRLGQLILDSEGRVITSTYRLAESMQQRITQTEGNQAAFNARLATMETRISEIEKRLNLSSSS